MKLQNSLRLSFIFVSLLNASLALAEIQIIGRSDTQAELNKEVCGADCTLKEFRLVVEKKRVLPPGLKTTPPFYMTDIRAVYSTQKTNQIESYAIVQWIQGCLFDSEIKDGQLNKWNPVVREHFNETKLFQHIGWEIDSDSFDPIYTSHPEYDRHSLLRWNVNPKSLDAETAKFWAAAKPPHTTVFATDLPGAATVNEMKNGKAISARNTSLQFKTCLYKTKDLPETTNPKGANIRPELAIACLDWDHSFIYNFQSQKFESPTEIDAFCKVPADPKGLGGLLLSN